MTRDRQLVDAQRRYYELRAPEYGDESRPDRKVPGLIPPAVGADIAGRLGATGDILELACGPGTFTQHLVTHARTVTAVDASPTMLERNRHLVDSDRVTYVEADLFAWEPSSTFDFVFFAAWLSHVPMSEFDSFWAMVRRCLRPDGRVAFFDEDERASVHDEVRVVGGTPVATRTLSDGRRYDIVKVFWTATELEARLRDMGWDITVTSLPEVPCFVGQGRDLANTES